MYEFDDADENPTGTDVAGRTGDAPLDSPALQTVVDTGATGAGGVVADDSAEDGGWCPEGDDLGVDALSPLNDWEATGDASGLDDGLGSWDFSSESETASSARYTDVDGTQVAGDGSVDDDLGPLAFDGSEVESRGPVRDDDVPNNLGPLGFDFVERGPVEQAAYEEVRNYAPYAPLADRELALHADEIAALHGEYDLDHAQAEHEAQESRESLIDSPIWLSPDERANMESGLSADVAEQIDRSIHDEAEAEAQSSLLSPDVVAHMGELDRLGHETNPSHAAAEIDAQQSRPVDESYWSETAPEPEPQRETGHDWGIRIVVGASVPDSTTLRPSAGFSGDAIKLELKNLTTGEVGVFEGLGVGAGWSTPSVDFGASSDWIVFRTADNHELEDFAGRASLSNVALGLETVHDSIRFADPDSSLPWFGDIDVEHERAADSILFGDSVDIRDATQHLGIGLSASTVFLDLRATRFEAPAPDLGDVVRDAMEQ